MKISIALATYNGEKHLREQLESYINQVRVPDEIIICDDASEDGTVEIIEKFNNIAPFDVKVIRNEKNLGYVKNFEKALSLCSGEIIFLSDQDDVWLPNKISKIIEVFEANPHTSIVIHDAYLADEDLNIGTTTKLNQVIFGGYQTDSLITGTLTAIKSDILNSILPFPKKLSVGHDVWIHAVGNLLNRRIVIKDILQTLRRHSANTSEWAVNSLTKITKIDIIKSQSKTIPASNYDDRINLNSALLEILNDTNFDIDIKGIKNKLYLENEVFIKRNKLVRTTSSLYRKVLAIKMLLRNDYKYFNGLSSFARDILR